jgi:hypothetical protein
VGSSHNKNHLGEIMGYNTKPILDVPILINVGIDHANQQLSSLGLGIYSLVKNDNDVDIKYSDGFKCKDSGKFADFLQTIINWDNHHDVMLSFVGDDVSWAYIISKDNVSVLGIPYY